MENALKGIRVLDLTRYLAGPFTTMILADLGAEVIKIEVPGEREQAPPIYTYKGQDAYFLSVNRNKKSIALNLKLPKARDIFYQLVKKSDVVIDNFRPGVPERLGTDYENLKKQNSAIIYCSITGFGPDGPLRDRPSFDLVAQALTGVMKLTGEPGRPPIRAGVAAADLSAGMFAAHGIMAALYARERTGKGQKVETSLLESLLALLSYEASCYFVSGEIPPPVGSGHRTLNPYGAYPTSDGYIAVAGMYHFEKLCKAIDKPEMAKEPEFNTIAARFANKDKLTSILNKRFKQKTSEQWLQILADGDVPSAPINSLDVALSHPQVLHRDMVISIEHCLGGQIKVIGNPIKMSGTEAEQKKYFFSPPVLGQHTREILTGYLGYASEQIKALEKEGVVQQYHKEME